MDHLVTTARELWTREWSRIADGRTEKHPHAFLQSGPTPGMLESLVDLIAEDPRRPVGELEPVIHRMLFEHQFIDDGGDSVIFDAFDCIEVQTRTLVDVLEQVRQRALQEGVWSAMPAAPMMFG